MSGSGADLPLPRETPQATRIGEASIVEQTVYDFLVGHAQNEADILEEYKRVADADASPALRYLSRLIAADERRHHDVFAELAASLRHTAELRAGQPPIPPLAELADDRERVLVLTERFLALEKDDLRDLRALARRLRDVRDTTLWVLLVELMQEDTRKHIRILEFVRQHVGADGPRRRQQVRRAQADDS